MLAPSEEFVDRPFSTSVAPQGERFALWSRLLNKWLLGAHSRQLGNESFRAAVRLRVLPDIRFGWGAVGASAYSRTRDVTAADNDDLFLFVNLGGTFVASGKRHDIELAPNQAYVMGCAELGTHARPTDGSLLALRVHHATMKPLVRNLDDKLGSAISAENQGLRLLSTYLRSVGDSEPLSSRGAQHVVTKHVHDLLALTLGADDTDAAACGDGVRAARLRAAKTLIRRSLSDPDLSAELTAARLAMSARSLQRLFESEGTTFSGFVADARVAEAHAALCDPKQQDRSIADIALDCGFGDISYFNRRFRSRYNASPSEVRFHARTIMKSR